MRGLPAFPSPQPTSSRGRFPDKPASRASIQQNGAFDSQGGGTKDHAHKKRNRAKIAEGINLTCTIRPDPL